jgi:hypothetical protein
VDLRDTESMNTALRSRYPASYEADYARWCAEQGALLREGRLDALDAVNLAEEIETLGRSEQRELENRLNVLLIHLLKWRYQPDERSAGWRGTIVEQRNRIARRLTESPSLKSYPAAILREEYESARLKAAGETGLDEAIFPETCPFPIVAVLDGAFLPD